MNDGIEVKKELEVEKEKLEKKRILLIAILVTCIGITSLLLIIHLIIDKCTEPKWQEAYAEASEEVRKEEERRNIEMMYNGAIQRHVGDSKKGSEVKLLIEEIISLNNQYVNESGKFTSVHNGSIDGDENSQVKAFRDSDKLDKVCYKANIYENPKNGKNTQARIDAATDQMRSFKQKISAGKKYKVEALKAEEIPIIYAIYISPTN